MTMTETIKKDSTLIECLNYLDDSIELYKDRVSKLEKLNKPNRKQEAWKYFPLKKLNNLPKNKGKKVTTTIQTGDQLDFINGFLTQSIDIDGVEINLSDTFNNRLNVVHEENPFTSLNTLTNNETVFINVTKKVLTPLKIRFHNDETDTIYTDPKLIITCKENSSIDILVTHEGNDTDSLENSSFKFNVEENAELNYLSIKTATRSIQESIEINCAANTYVNASYIVPSTTVSRHDAEVNLNGSNSKCYLNGLGILKSEESFTFKTRVHHRVEECESYQHFKNILSGKSMAEYNGLVEVYKDAQLTDSYQLNRNLILSDTAKAFSRPQLRIFADDVKCSHGSTTGQIEESEILYLMSRGLTRTQAHAILVFGFADEVLESSKCKFAHDEVRILLKESLKSLS